MTNAERSAAVLSHTILQGILHAQICHGGALPLVITDLAARLERLNTMPGKVTKAEALVLISIMEYLHNLTNLDKDTI